MNTILQKNSPCDLCDRCYHIHSICWYCIGKDLLVQSWIDQESLDTQSQSYCQLSNHLLVMKLSNKPGGQFGVSIANKTEVSNKPSSHCQPPPHSNYPSQYRHDISIFLLENDIVVFVETTKIRADALLSQIKRCSQSITINAIKW